MQFKLHIGNLPNNCPTESVKDVFSPYGEILDTVVIQNYAFVTYSNKSDADKALKDLHKSKLLGNEITVEHAKSKRSDGNRNNNRRDRDGWNKDNNRRSFGRDERSRNNNISNPNTNLLTQLSQIGGILGAGPSGPAAANVPALGLLHTLNAAVAGQLEQNRNREANAPRQQEPQQREPPVPRDQPDPDVRVRREVVHVREVPKAAEFGLTSGYVIHERYYVDPSHPLLRGIPITELPRLNDRKRASPSRERQRERDSYGDESYHANHRQDNNYSNRRESPTRNRDFDYDRY